MAATSFAITNTNISKEKSKIFGKDEEITPEEKEEEKTEEITPEEKPKICERRQKGLSTEGFSCCE